MAREVRLYEAVGIAFQVPPSFVGKVWTKEELMQSVGKQVQSNQSKKMPVSVKS